MPDPIRVMQASVTLPARYMAGVATALLEQGLPCARFTLVVREHADSPPALTARIDAAMRTTILAMLNAIAVSSPHAVVTIAADEENLPSETATRVAAAALAQAERERDEDETEPVSASGYAATTSEAPSVPDMRVVPKFVSSTATTTQAQSGPVVSPIKTGAARQGVGNGDANRKLARNDKAKRALYWRIQRERRIIKAQLEQMKPSIRSIDPKTIRFVPPPASFGPMGLGEGVSAMAAAAS